MFIIPRVAVEVLQLVYLHPPAPRALVCNFVSAAHYKTRGSLWNPGNRVVSATRFFNRVFLYSSQTNT